MTDSAINSPLFENLSLGQRLWHLRKGEERLAMMFSQRFDIPLILGTILARRGLALEEVESFLNPGLKNSLPDPSQFKDMDRGVERVIQALKRGEKVAIFGDYDVDGATSSALLYRYGTNLGMDMIVYIPDRLTEGYGPNIKAFEYLASQGVKLVITVDCGMTAFEPLKAAVDLGLDVIIIDHHMPESLFPQAYAVINPNRLDEKGTYGYLAAVGVCFLFLVGLNRALRKQKFFADRSEPDLLSFLDLVALGTVCDVVPLKSLNRVFVSRGLQIAALRQNLGLKTLMDIAAIKEKISAYHFGFILGPRINAGGRVGKSDLGIRLLTTTSITVAEQISRDLHDFNRERQEIEQQVLQEATLQAHSRTEALLIVHGLHWHPGVIGIVAGRLKEQFNRPVLVISIDEQGMGKGSGRSVPNVDLGALIHAAKGQGLLKAGGGHAMAVGFTIDQDKIEDLKVFLNNHLVNSQWDLTPRLYIDSALTLKGATATFVKDLDKLAPYGQANPAPRFIFEKIRILKPSLVGQDHVRCLLTSEEGSRLTAISFRSLNTPLGDALLNSKGEEMHVVGTLKLDTWLDQDRVQMTIEDAMFARPLLQ